MPVYYEQPREREGLEPAEPGLPRPGDDVPPITGGGTPPPATSPRYPNLIRVPGYPGWYDPVSDQWYNDQYQKVSKPVNRFPEDDPDDPYDNPINDDTRDDGYAPTVRIDVTGGTGSPDDPLRGNTSAQYPAPPTDYLPVPPAWGGSGEYELANPMPPRPTYGTMPTPASQAWSVNQGRAASGQEPFQPWGETIGYLSQALRYGGSPRISSMGGYEGTTAPTGDPLDPINRPAVPGWTMPRPGGSIGPGLPGRVLDRDRNTDLPGFGSPPPPGGYMGGGLPGRPRPGGDEPPAAPPPDPNNPLASARTPNGSINLFLLHQLALQRQAAEAAALREMENTFGDPTGVV